MRALVATVSHLLHVDLDNGEVSVVEANRQEYYGVSWFPGRPGLVLSHSGVDNASLVSIDEYANSERGWVTFGDTQSERFLSQPHQILCCSDGRIVCTNTGRNRIVAIDLDKPGHFHEARISELNWDRLGRDSGFGDHLNSLFQAGNRLYVLAHGYHRGSAVATFSYPDLTLLSVDRVRGRFEMHNVFVSEDGQIIGCASAASGLLDIGANRLLWEAGSDVYPRGLAVGADVVILGESALGAREDRRTSLAGLWILNRRTWQAVDYVPLGRFGTVHEVRIIDQPDYAHHGVALSPPDLISLNDRGAVASDMADLRDDRLSTAAAMARLSGLWKGWERYLHTGQPDGDWLVAGHRLAMIVRPVTRKGWSFDYSLEPSGHVSAVFGYGGVGDTCMSALLLQRNDSAASLRLWVHNGEAWQGGSIIVADGLPVRGRIDASQINRHVSLAIDGNPVFGGELPISDQGLQGVRAQQARVRLVSKP